MVSWCGVISAAAWQHAHVLIVIHNVPVLAWRYEYEGIDAPPVVARRARATGGASECVWAYSQIVSVHHAEAVLSWYYLVHVDINK